MMRELTFTAAAREGLSEEMARDPAVFVMGEGIGERGGNWATTTGLYETYGPWRLRDTPISERGFTGLCTGAALVCSWISSSTLWARSSTRPPRCNT